MTTMTGLVTLEVGEFRGHENDGSACAPMIALHPLGEQGQGWQTQHSQEMHPPRRAEHHEPAWRGVPL